ncbi:MAG: HD domain-containing protein [Tissierellia bacterium]|nr:HD domain-containing protein [Tissierellia bacterium]
MVMAYEKYYNKIEEKIGTDRFNHCIRVAEKSIYLANIYGVDEEKAEIAGMFHDCCKYKDEEILIKKASKYKILEPYLWSGYRKVLHAKLGAVIAKEKYSIEDEDILNAIYYHTTGRACMSKLEKIVFLADITESSRTYDGVEILRKLEVESLDLAMREALSQSLVKLVGNRAFIAEDTISAYNYYLIRW